MPPKPQLSAPLSDAEFATLAAALPAASRFDADGVLGVLHAVAIAPSLLAPSEWLPTLLPEGIPDGPKGENLLGLLLRLYNEVLGDLARHESMIPRPEEEAACASFAAGYVAGAELDPVWRDDADRWGLVLGFAYVGGRLDVIPDDRLADVEAKGKDHFRQKMDRIVASTDEVFTMLRRAAAPPPERAAAARPRVPASVAEGGRVGRNDACPCGSGKKFKKCCIDKPAVGGGA